MAAAVAHVDEGWGSDAVSGGVGVDLGFLCIQAKVFISKSFPVASSQRSKLVLVGAVCVAGAAAAGLFSWFLVVLPLYARNLQGPGQLEAKPCVDVATDLCLQVASTAQGVRMHA